MNRDEPAPVRCRPAPTAGAPWSSATSTASTSPGGGQNLLGLREGSHPLTTP